jgi:hypothetical protein
MSITISARTADSHPDYGFCGAGEPYLKEYDDAQIKIMPRDRNCFYAFWEISEDEIREAKNIFEKDSYEPGSLILRVFDLTEMSLDSKNGQNYYDISIKAGATSLFIETKTLNRSYCVEIGLKTPGNLFFPIARSNVLRMPKVLFSTIGDIIDLEGLNKLLEINLAD